MIAYTDPRASAFISVWKKTQGSWNSSTIRRIVTGTRAAKRKTQWQILGDVESPLERRRHRYIDSTSSPNPSIIELRFSFCVAVSSPSSWSSSFGIKRNLRMFSTRANRSLVCLTTSPISSMTSGFSDEVAVRGVRDAPPQGPVADGVELDADEGGDVRLAVADHHRLFDVRRRLQAVLDLRRRDVLAARRDDDVLDAVDDPNVRAVDPLADVARHQPPVVGERLGGLVGLVPVAGEHAVVLGLDLAGELVDAEPDAGVGLADGAELHAVHHVAGRDRRVLGHAVELVHGDADADEELEDLGGDGRRTGARVPAAAQAEPLAHRPEDDHPAEGVQDAATTTVWSPPWATLILPIRRPELEARS